MSSKTFRVKVEGKKSGQIANLELTVDPSRDGSWRRVGGTLQLIGQKGPVKRGSVDVSKGNLFFAGDGSGMQFMGVDEDLNTKKCGSLNGDGALYMPAGEARASALVIKEQITWEILDPCDVS